MTPQLYSILLTKYKQEYEEDNGFSIPADIRRNLTAFNFRDLNLFQSLQDILDAFVAYRPDIGLVQGMTYLVSILIPYLEPYKAFECLTNMIFNSELLRTFYSYDLAGVQSYYRVFEYYMQKYVPNVYNRFDDLGITSDSYLLEWVYTLFSRCFSIDIVR